MGVRRKHVPFGGTGPPPGGPVVAQRAVTLLGAFVRSKEGDAHAFLPQHIGNQRGHSHVACVKREVNRLVASLFIAVMGCGAHIH